MNDFQKKLKEKINLYSKESYLDGYMEDEYTISNGYADVYNGKTISFKIRHL